MADDIEDLLRDPPFALTETDRLTLRQTDAEFVPHTWEDLRGVIATKDTSTLRRTPTGLANYMRWSRLMRTRWSSVREYILSHRLHWGADDDAVLVPSDHTIFADPSDYAIRRNDWPYGCDPGIVHLVVWMKGRIRIDAAAEGDPVPEDEALIQAFVARQFARPLGASLRAEGEGVGWVTDDRRQEVMWFRNRLRYQSVRALEHIHVLLRNVPESLIAQWTNGQRAGETIAEKWARGEQTF